MLSKHLQFFQPIARPTPGVQLQGLIKLPDSIVQLHRGFKEIPSLMFHFPTLISGIFGLTFPSVISIEEIKLHKLTNLSNDKHMVSMSSDAVVAARWGQGCYITIDPTLFRQSIVDLHASYGFNGLTLPGRMKCELEHVALAVPFCCIKKITIQDEEIDNPFYITIDPSHLEAKQAFDAIYSQFIILLRNKYTKHLGDEEESRDLQDFVWNYIRFYEKYSIIVNPFNHTVRELFQKYPAFMGRFIALNPQLDHDTLIRDLAKQNAGNLFKEHQYTQSLTPDRLERTATPITIYDDPWARPNYD